MKPFFGLIPPPFPPPSSNGYKTSFFEAFKALFILNFLGTDIELPN